MHHRKVVTQQLKRNHVQETLKCINSAWNLNFREVFRETRVGLVARVSGVIGIMYQMRIGLPLRAVTCSRAEYTLGYK